MNIPILIASPQGRNSETAELANETVSELQRVGFRTEVLFTSDLSFAACGGCFSCESTDECIVQDDVQMLQVKFEEAVGFVLATPVYLQGPPGRLKCLLDRFWPYSLRPRLFGRHAGILVTSGNFGALDVAEYLTSVIESWGIRVVQSVTAALLTRDASEQRKKSFLQCRLLGRRLIDAIEKKKRIGWSSRGKRYVSNLWGLIQDNKDRFSTSYEYWRENEITKKFGL